MSDYELKEKFTKKQRDLSRKSVKPPFPERIKIDICNVCNFSCIFCPQAKQYDKIGCIDKELCYKLIKDAYDAGGRELCLAGTGEPLINSELEAYVRYAKQTGYRYVFINTNGSLLNENRSMRLLEAGIDSVKVSVNSSENSYELIHGINAWETVVKNIMKFDALRKGGEYNCRLYISYVAVKQTLKEVDQMKSVLANYVDEIIVMNANNRGGSAGEIDNDLYIGENEFSFQYPCSQIFNNVYVTAEGYLVICCQDFENLTVVADLHKETLAQAWTNECFTKFREKYLKHDLKGTLCQNCLYHTMETVIPLNVQEDFYKNSDIKRKKLYDRIRQLESSCK